MYDLDIPAPKFCNLSKNPKNIEIFSRENKNMRGNTIFIIF